MSNLVLGSIQEEFPAGTAVTKVNYSFTGRIAGSAPITGSVSPGATTLTLPLVADVYDYTFDNQDANGSTLDQVFAGSLDNTAAGGGTPPADVTLTLINSATLAPS